MLGVEKRPRKRTRSASSAKDLTLGVRGGCGSGGEAKPSIRGAQPRGCIGYGWRGRLYRINHAQGRWKKPSQACMDQRQNREHFALFRPSAQSWRAVGIPWWCLLTPTRPDGGRRQCKRTCRLWFHRSGGIDLPALLTWGWTKLQADQPLTTQRW